MATYPYIETDHLVNDTTAEVEDIKPLFDDLQEALHDVQTVAEDAQADAATAVAGLYTQGCRVYNSADISVPHNTATALTFNSERYDTDNMHSTSVNTSRITFNTAGKYMIVGQVMWTVGSGGCVLQIRKNGSTFIARLDYAPAVGQGGIVSTIDDFAASDYVELVVTQTSGVSANAIAYGQAAPYFMAQRIG